MSPEYQRLPWTELHELSLAELDHHREQVRRALLDASDGRYHRDWMERALVQYTALVYEVAMRDGRLFL